MQTGEDVDKRNGIISLAFSGQNGSFHQLFSSSQEDAVSIFTACFHVSKASTPILVSASHMNDTVCNKPITGGGDNMDKRLAVLEAEVGHIRRDVDELKGDVKSIDRNMITALERLETIKENLSDKPSTTAVDRKISDAKLAILLGVPAIITIVAGLYKLIMHFCFPAA